MELILWRHAEAQEAAIGLPDLKRQLTSRGEKQAHHVAHWLREQQPKNLRILVSPAVRCQQTIYPLALRFATDSRIGPTANVNEILTAVEWFADNAQHGGATLLVGHQPTLGRLAALLLSGHEANWTIRKGALWWFSRRMREGKEQTILRTVIEPDMI